MLINANYATNTGYFRRTQGTVELVFQLAIRMDVLCLWFLISLRASTQILCQTLNVVLVCYLMHPPIAGH